jgi:hypothetical protein
MALNGETPYVGDQAVQAFADVTSPNVLKAVVPPERPDPTKIPPVVEDGTASVVGDSTVVSAVTEDITSHVESGEPEAK